MKNVVLKQDSRGSMKDVVLKQPLPLDGKRLFKYWETGRLGEKTSTEFELKRGITSLRLTVGH